MTDLTYFGPEVSALSDEDVTSVLRNIRRLEQLEAELRELQTMRQSVHRCKEKLDRLEQLEAEALAQEKITE